MRSVYEAFNRRDFGAAAEHLHPEGEVYPGVVGLDPAGPGSSRRLCGRDELRLFFEDLGATWETVAVEFEEVVEATDGRVLVVERWRLGGRDGIEVVTTIIDVYTVRDGLIVRVDGFLDRAEALEAVALRD